MADPDLSGLSTEQLLQIAKGGGATSAAAPDLSKVSNEQLQAIARGQQQPSPGYFGTQRQMAEESVGLMKQGLEQLAKPTGGNLPESAKAAALGVGALGAGAAGFVGSPLSAAYRKVVGEPLEKTTGIPKEYSEFAAQLATPGLGLVGPAIKTLAGTGKVGTTAEALKAAYVAQKTSPEMAAALIPREISTPAVATAKAQLAKELLPPRLAGDTHFVLDTIANPPGGQLTMEILENARKRLNSIARSSGNDADAANIAKQYIDEIGKVGAPEQAGAMTEARANYARGKLMESLNAKLQKGELQAGGLGGFKLDEKLRQNVGTFLGSKDAKFLNPEETKMLQEFVDGKAGRNTLMRVSSILSGGGGGFGGAVAAEVGARVIPRLGGLTPVVGHALRFVGNRIAAADAAKLADTVASNSPLGRQMRASLDAFNRVQEAASTAPGLTPRLVAQLTIQSRNLANNLKDAGIQVTPESLIGTPQPAFMGQNGNQPPQP